jgi:hypothetical protein
VLQEWLGAFSSASLIGNVGRSIINARVRDKQKSVDSGSKPTPMVHKSTNGVHHLGVSHPPTAIFWPRRLDLVAVEETVRPLSQKILVVLAQQGHVIFLSGLRFGKEESPVGILIPKVPLG